MKTKTISAPDVAYILRRELGPWRAWGDCLADMRRGRTDVHGHLLTPVARTREGGALRPLYLASDVVEFIKAVRHTDPTATRHAPPQVKTVFLDPADMRHWKLRKVVAAATTFIVGRPLLLS